MLKIIAVLTPVYFFVVSKRAKLKKKKVRKRKIIPDYFKQL